MKYAPVDVPELPGHAHAAIHDIFGEAYESPNSEQILSVCLGVARFLMQKNAAYGDSALNPLRVFSKADPVEQIRVRMDDKISRLSRGDLAGEDAELDLLGYLVLLLVVRKDRPE
jgi:hypothetical protein